MLFILGYKVSRWQPRFKLLLVWLQNSNSSNTLGSVLFLLLSHLLSATPTGWSTTMTSSPSMDLRGLGGASGKGGITSTNTLRSVHYIILHDHNDSIMLYKNTKTFMALKAFSRLSE